MRAWVGGWMRAWWVGGRVAGCGWERGTRLAGSGLYNVVLTCDRWRGRPLLVRLQHVYHAVERWPVQRTRGPALDDQRIERVLGRELLRSRAVAVNLIEVGTAAADERRDARAHVEEDHTEAVHVDLVVVLLNVWGEWGEWG